MKLLLGTWLADDAAGFVAGIDFQVTRASLKNISMKVILRLYGSCFGLR